MKPTLLILAAGMGSRYGGLKQIDPIGPKGEALIEFSIYDAIRAGFGKVVFIIRSSIEDAFKEKLSNKFEDRIQIEYAFQEYDSPIEGIDEFPHREKPWGTAHAVLVARDKINEPFAVINADDYYGIDAFKTMADFLVDQCHPNLYNMIGYKLENTLSDNGTVNRGVCDMDENSFLTDVNERLKVRRVDNHAEYLDDDETLKPLPLDSLVSMNFWGFHHNIFERMHKEFVEFVEENKDKPRAEFFIPLVVNSLIEEGKTKILVQSSNDQWYGITYKDDKPAVEVAFEKLIKEGAYPAEGLWEKVPS